MEKYTKIIIFILILVLIFILWSIFIKPDPQPEELLTTTGGPTTDTDRWGNEIKETLNRMSAIKLEKNVFDHKILTNLVDESRPIPINPIGRENPFEKIDQNVRNTSNTTNSGSNPN